VGARLSGAARSGDQVFVEEVDARVDPLSPANKIIWATGPLTGTMASTGGVTRLITKGALPARSLLQLRRLLGAAELKFCRLGT